MGIQVTANVENLETVLKNLDKLEDFDEFDKALYKCGLEVEASAKEILVTSGRVNTGLLVGSIKTSDVIDHEVTVYTTVPYATYIEYGTGIFAENGNGRPGWWVYVDEECGAPKSKERKIYTYEEACKVWYSLAEKYGKDHVHMTQGQLPVRFMRNGYNKNKDKIIEVLQEIVNRKVDEANA